MLFSKPTIIVCTNIPQFPHLQLTITLLYFNNPVEFAPCSPCASRSCNMCEYPFRCKCGRRHFALIVFHQHWVHLTISSKFSGSLCMLCFFRFSRMIVLIFSFSSEEIVCSEAYMCVILVRFSPRAKAFQVLAFTL